MPNPNIRPRQRQSGADTSADDDWVRIFYVVSHKMLDEAWPRYTKILPLARRGATSVKTRPQDVLRKVAALLAFDGPYCIQITVNVGEFDNNAFSFKRDGKPVVAIPVEMSTDLRELVFTPEMTHAVHFETAGLVIAGDSGGYPAGAGVVGL